MGIIFAFSNALISAVYFVYVSQTLKTRPGLSSGMTLAVSHLSGALILLPIWWYMPHAPGDSMADGALFWTLALAAGLLVLSRELYFYAYARTDVANITVFSALTPVYTIGTGYFMLAEVPSNLDLIGLLLICGSIYTLFLRTLPETPWHAALLQPFRHIVSSTPILCAFLSTIPTAFAATYQKQLLLHLSPVSFSFFLLLFIGIAASAISVVLLKPAGVAAQMKQLPYHFMLVSALLLPATHVLFCFVMRQHLTAVALVLQRSSILFQIILAYLFLHEQRDMGKRIMVAAGIMAGFILIMIKS